jgi:hypothetical protein
VAGEHLRAAGLAAPVLKAAGFTRRRNEFQRLEPNGFVSVVGFYPGRPGFAIQYGTVTPKALELRASRGIRRPEWLTTAEAFLFALVFHPGWADSADEGDNFPYRWRAPFVEEERLPGQLTDVLNGEVLPNLKSWTDIPTLVQRIRDQPPGTFTGVPGRGIAVVWFEGGPSAELDAALSALVPDDPVRTWIEGELAKLK